MKTYKSSINFKKSVGIAQIEHNENLRPGYRINDDKPLVNKPTSQAIADRQRFIDKAIDDYMSQNKSKNPRFQAKDYDYSAVVNIKPDTTLADLQRLADFLHDDYGFQCYQISIHRDEGHINDNGEKVINHHAHLEFITLDDKNGKNNYRKINRTALRKIQDKTAEILAMERGEYIENSKVKRIEPRAYAQMKEQEKQATKELKADLEQVKAENKQLKADLVSQKAVNTAFEEIRQLMIADKISTADDYKELAKYKKQAQAQAKSKELTKEQLDNQIAQIQQSYNDKLKAKDEELKKKNEEIEKLEKDIKVQASWHAENSASYATQLKEKQKIINDKDNEIYDLKNKAPTSQNKSDDVKDRIIDLEKQNKDLKADLETINNKFDAYIKNVNVILEYIFEKFKISNIVELAFNWKKSQAPQSAESSQEIQLTPKVDIQKNNSNQNKGRGGR